MCFSYVPQDFRTLAGLGGNPSCAAWMEENYDRLRALALAENARLELRLSVTTCRGVD